MGEPGVSLVAVVVAAELVVRKAERVENLEEADAGDDAAAVAVAVAVVGQRDKHCVLPTVRDVLGFGDCHTSYLAAHCLHWQQVRAGTALCPKDAGRRAH